MIDILHLFRYEREPQAWLTREISLLPSAKLFLQAQRIEMPGMTIRCIGGDLDEVFDRLRGQRFDMVVYEMQPPDRDARRWIEHELLKDAQ